MAWKLENVLLCPESKATYLVPSTDALQPTNEIAGYSTELCSIKVGIVVNLCSHNISLSLAIRNLRTYTDLDNPQLEVAGYYE